MLRTGQDMRFIWLTRDLPLLPQTGAHLYSNGLIRALCGTGATGTLISYAAPNAYIDNVAGLSLSLITLPHKLRALSLLSPLQSDAYRLKSKTFSSVLGQELSQRPDVVVVDYFSMGWVLSTIKAEYLRSGFSIPLVYISHNYEPALRRQVAASADNWFMRQVLKLDAEKAARLDLRLARNVDLVVVNTDDDKRAYQNDLPDKRILTLVPAYDGRIMPVVPIDRNTPRRVAIVGSFEWIAKQQSLKRFLRAAEGPFRSAGIDLLVVGKVPQPIIGELSAKYSFCRFTGWVDDVQEHLHGVRVGVMPDEVGGGFKHKYLYYIFSGLAVASIRSQVVGLPIDSARDLIVGDSVEELVEAVIQSIDDIPRLNSMRIRCWEACASAFSWSERGKRLNEAIHAICEKKAPPSLESSRKEVDAGSVPDPI